MDELKEKVAAELRENQRLVERIANIVADYADGMMDCPEDAALTILEAIREPTREMILRTWESDIRDMKTGQPIDAVFAWRAMIDTELGFERDPKASDSPKPNLGHSISTNKRTPV